jgi:hypothetical protein
VDPAGYRGFVDFCRQVDVIESRELVYGVAGDM